MVMSSYLREFSKIFLLKSSDKYILLYGSVNGSTVRQKQLRTQCMKVNRSCTFDFNLLGTDWQHDCSQALRFLTGVNA